MKNVIKSTLNKLGILAKIKKLLTKDPNANLPVVDGKSLKYESNNKLFYHVNSLEEYNIYKEQMKEAFAKRSILEKELAKSQKPLRLKGYDPIEGNEVLYYIGYESSWYTDGSGFKIPNYRESLINLQNNFNCRLRATVLAIYHLHSKESLNNKEIYLTEELTGFYQFFKKNFKNVTGSEYLGDSVPGGKVINGIRHEDLTNLSFANNSFDVLVALEVMEHIPDYMKALSEIYRVLKTGGTAIITAPFDCSMYENTIRAVIGKDGKIDHILPPEYHGDPVHTDNGILCFQCFGWEVLDQLKKSGFSNTGTLFTWSLQNGILGEDIMVIHATK